MKVLVLTLGGTIDPLVKSIEEGRPQKVVIIASKKTLKLVEDIRELTDHEDIVVEVTENENDLNDFFMRSLNAIKKFDGSGHEVLIDYTGGTKNMSVALALASFGKGVKYLYVGGDERTKDDVGIVKAGHERVYHHVDPADMYFIKTAEKVVYLFNKKKYALACDLVEDAKRNPPCILHKKELSKISALTEALQFWDRMDYHNAYAKLNSWFKNAGLESRLFEMTIQDCFKRHLEKCDAKNTNNILSDMIENAQRRAAQGDFDEAVLRLYRAVEYIATHEPGAPAPKEKVGLWDIFQRLYEKDNRVGRIHHENQKEFKSFFKKRHNSILAHGNNALGKKDVENGLKLVGMLFNNNCPFKYPEIRYKL